MRGDDLFFGTIAAILIILCVLFVVGLSKTYIESKKDMEICENRFLGYKNVYVDDLTDAIEPGYLRCCWTSYINHVGTKSCEIIKK